MFILIQSKIEKIKYVTSKDYDKIVEYINTRFSHVHQYNRWYFKSSDGIEFKIVLGDDIDEQSL